MRPPTTPKEHGYCVRPLSTSDLHTHRTASTDCPGGGCADRSVRRMVCLGWCGRQTPSPILPSLSHWPSFGKLTALKHLTVRVKAIPENELSVVLKSFGSHKRVDCKHGGRYKGGTGGSDAAIAEATAGRWLSSIQAPLSKARSMWQLWSNAIGIAGSVDAAL